MQKAYSIGSGTIIIQPETTFIGSGARIGMDCKIHPFTYIGKNVYIGTDCIIQAYTFIPEGPKIYDRVFIGPRVTFTNDKNPPSHGRWLEEKQIIVNSSSIICADVTILPGVFIGANAFIAAGSLVTKDVPAGGFAVGRPAQIFESRDDWTTNSGIKKLMELRF